MRGSRRRRVAFTAPAERDLNDIFRYLSRHDLALAERQLLEIIECCASLDTLAERGTLRPKLAENLRQLVVGPYLAFYRIRDDVVEIVRVLHSKRDVSSEF